MKTVTTYLTFISLVKFLINIIIVGVLSLKMSISLVADLSMFIIHREAANASFLAPENIAFTYNIYSQHMFQIKVTYIYRYL